MRTFSAKSVVVVAALAGASVSGWAKVSTQQGGQQDMLLATAQIGMQRAVVGDDHPGLQTAAFYPAPAALGRPQADSVATATAVQEPAPGQEKANMGMMILVGLGMVGTLIFKSKRS
jgi:hypothetical protein